MRLILRGIIAELTTPYNGYGGIDTDGVGRLVERAITGGVAAILLNGPIGEGPHLSRGERLFVIEAATEAAAGRVPLYVATGAVGAEETLALTWDAGNAGIAAAFIAPPFYYRLSQAALVAHYRTITRRARLPLVVHNVPTPSGNILTPASLAALAEVEGIVALAQGDAGADRFAETMRLIDGRLPILAARDAAAYATLSAGAAGLISATAGIFPEAVVAVEVAVAAGDQQTARQRWLALQRFNRFLGDAGMAVAVCKIALSALGLPGGEPRAPLPPLDDTTQAFVREVIASLASTEGTPARSDHDSVSSATVTIDLPDGA